ncbi:uncharacterized protein KIAA1143 homolog [Dendronephthya gigantea]|uniref:uncharacterized protein KIAA1143 homolog n=1 Tax=Dendronephthya gigantea TaxID=151771 RepID=UPI00106D41E1|nr:uncharacterized protein KIAA1143 homolog [Dendronephthya gigantea]
MAAKSRNVKYVQQDEPSFLKKFKERVGYKEQANISDKFSDEVDRLKNESDENEQENENEEPVVVVLKPGDMTAEEVAKFKEENSSEDCWDSKNDKPIFKKPDKRPTDGKDGKKNVKKKKVDIKAVKNSKLLSFDEEDDEG